MFYGQFRRMCVDSFYQIWYRLFTSFRFGGQKKLSQKSSFEIPLQFILVVSPSIDFTLFVEDSHFEDNFLDFYFLPG